MKNIEQLFRDNNLYGKYDRALENKDYYSMFKEILENSPSPEQLKDAYDNGRSDGYDEGYDEGYSNAEEDSE